MDERAVEGVQDLDNHRSVGCVQEIGVWIYTYNNEAASGKFEERLELDTEVRMS